MRRSLLIAAILILTSHIACAADHACSVPAILRISKTSAGLMYQIDDHVPHRLYSLGEASHAVRDCKTERMLFVVASAEVPVGNLQVPSKEQIEHIRYFVQYTANDFWELGTDQYFHALPITPDILPQPIYDDIPPPQAATKLKGSK